MMNKLPHPIITISCLFLLPVLCVIIVQGCERSARAGEPVPEPESYSVLLVFSDPRCGACKRDKPIVDDMRGKVDMIFFGWGDRDAVKHFGVSCVPTYILLTAEGAPPAVLGEMWRTHSATVARDRLGLSP